VKSATPDVMVVLSDFFHSTLSSTFVKPVISQDIVARVPASCSLSSAFTAEIRGFVV